ALAPFFRSAASRAGETPAESAPPQPVAVSRAVVPVQAAPDTGWASLVDIEGPSSLSERSSAAKPPEAGPQSRRMKPRAITAIAVGVLLLGALLAWAIVFKLKTPDGTIVIEGLPDDAVVEVDGAKATITRPGDGKPVTVSAVPGTHKVRVVRDGVELTAEEVTLAAGGRPPIRVDIEPLPAKGQAVAKSGGDP